MRITLKEVLANLPTKRVEKIKARAKELENEEKAMSLSEHSY